MILDLLPVLNAVSSMVICIWAMWCILCPYIRDGLIGKMIYGIVAFSAYGVAVRPDHFTLTAPTVSGMTLHVALAALGVRHMFVLQFWPSLKRFVSRHLLQEGRR